MLHVLKRDGAREPVDFAAIQTRIASRCEGLQGADAARVTQRVVQGLTDNIRTSELDELAAQTAAALSTQHPDYGRLAARIAVSNLHKETQPSMRAIYHIMADDVLAFAKDHADELDAALDWDKDYRYDYFGFKTLEKAYLTRDVQGNVVERPQVMLMRVALGIHCGDMDSTILTYKMMARGVFTHATPTMFNAGTKHPHMASCFLLTMSEDSIEGIFETLKKCALISKSAGGIGISVTNVRAANSRIHSTGGKSAGLLPFLRIYDTTARAVDQGGGKRKGAFAAYLEPWHADIRSFLDMKKNHGQEELRARDLFYGLWIPDLFMRRVEANESWSLFCPAACPDLVDLHGEAFEKRYREYEATEGLAVATMPAQELWFAVLDAQIETGTPYLLYKDACNAKSNQQNLGTIRCSNLCTEIVQYSSADEVAVCNLASVALPSFVLPTTQEGELAIFDHRALASAVRIVTQNLNKVIDRNAYPLEEAKRSNFRHRPVGIGVQGLADVFFLLDMPFDCPAARVLNRQIFETIYYAALEESCNLAREFGPYETYDGSPMSQGKLQMDLWEDRENIKVPLGVRWDWVALRAKIKTYGVRNSLLVAPMPTASTAQILGNVEATEPITSNLYVRRVLAGEFAVVNKRLVRHLEALGLWTEDVRLAIIRGNGSVQDVPEIPDHLKAVFKTAREISMRTLIDQAADRAPFVDQSMSFNVFVREPTHARLSSMAFYAWKKGLKTGQYYVRTRPAADAVKVTVPVSTPAPSCRRDDPECLSCSA